jgi:hypothetical protein
VLVAEYQGSPQCMQRVPSPPPAGPLLLQILSAGGGTGGKGGVRGGSELHALTEGDIILTLALHCAK